MSKWHAHMVNGTREVCEGPCRDEGEDEATEYVRADLYDAVVAERDEARRERDEARGTNERWERVSALSDYVRLDRMWQGLVLERDAFRRELRTAENERDAARAEVERLRPVVEAAQVFDRFHIVDLEHGADLSDLYWPARRAYDALEKAVAAYRAAKQGA